MPLLTRVRKSPAKSRTDNYKTVSCRPGNDKKSLFLIRNLAHPERFELPTKWFEAPIASAI